MQRILANIFLLDIIKEKGGIGYEENIIITFNLNAKY